MQPEPTDDDLVASGCEAATPTPLFLAFLGALLLSAVFTLHGGVTRSSVADFLFLAAIISGSVIAAFGGIMIWATRAGQRASELARIRPGATVIRGTRTPELAKRLIAVGRTGRFVPVGVTVVADETGIELWSGAAEHPVRIARTQWASVADVRSTRIARWGRVTKGIVVTVVDRRDGSHIELPFAVTGAGLGGVFSPPWAEVLAHVDALRARRETFVATY